MSARVYKSAQALIDEHGLNPEQIEGTGSKGAVTKGDVEDYLASQTKKQPKVKRAKKAKKGKAPKKAKKPSAQDLIHAGLEAGKSNDEIEADVLEQIPDCKIAGHAASWVGWTIGNERRKGSDWWKEHGPAIAKRRGVKLA